MTCAQEDFEPTAREGVRVAEVTLADGQRWGLALPTLRYRPSVVRSVDALGRSSETIELVVEAGYPIGIRRAIDALRAACEHGTTPDQEQAICSLGVALVMQAHQVDSSFAASLFDATSSEFVRVAEVILNTVTSHAHDL